jgi:hypothetical protein
MGDVCSCPTAGRVGGLLFSPGSRAQWRDRTREVDFMVDAGGRLELFEAKWTELPDIGDTVNLDFVRDVVGKSRVTGGALVAPTPNSFPFSNGFPSAPRERTLRIRRSSRCHLL